MARKIPERTVVGLARRYVKLFPAEAARTLIRADPSGAADLIAGLDDGAAVVALQQAGPETLAAWLTRLPPDRLELLGRRLDRAKAAAALSFVSETDHDRIAAAVGRTPRPSPEQ